MLDIQFIRDNQQLVKTVCKNKNVKIDVGQLLKTDQDRASLHSQLDELRRQRNQLSAQGGKTKPKAADIKKAKQLKNNINVLETKFAEIDANYQRLLERVPNIYADDTPVGPDDSHNKVLRHWGDKPQFSFKPKPHWELGRELDLIDSERAAKVAGSRFTYLKGSLVRLEFALWGLVLDTLTDADILQNIATQAKLDIAATPFTPVLPPQLIKEAVFTKTGRREPVEDKYYLDKDGLFMIGSAEHTLAPLHMDELVNQADLPLRYVGYSTNLRREAGSYGKDVRGILRLHQFNKWEMFSLSEPSDGQKEQDFIIAIQEYLMQQLELPYQVVAISTGDMGKPDYRQIDIEAWLPGQNKYRETQTADWNTDFQARRLNIRYKDQDGNRQFVHTNDATALSERPLIAILENYQTEAGKIKIPSVLQKYMRGEKYL